MFTGLVLDSEESKNVAVVHKTNQGYSGKDLWRLKQERPELFAHASSSTAQGQAESGKHFCCDWGTGEYYEVHKGEDLTSALSIRGDAATSASNGTPSSRHVIISDLHRAAASMRLDLTHHGSPAAMFAVHDACASGAAVAEAAAKGFHVRLLPRLAAYRGFWQDDRLCTTVVESIETLATEIGCPSGIGVAVALLLGRRLTLAAARGAVCMPFGGEQMEVGHFDVGSDDDKLSPISTRCFNIDDGYLGVLLTVAPVRTAGLTPTQLRDIVRPHIRGERPKAACVAALNEVRGRCSEASLVAAAVRFIWAQPELDMPAAKRLRGETSSKARCRHILLRHVGCQPTGERRPKPTRTLCEAETQLARVIDEFAKGGATSFTAQCKAISECNTALRGGDLAGDLGWLDCDPTKNKKVPAAVVKAAFTIGVGQLSDIISSDRGVHVLLRTA